MLPAFDQVSVLERYSIYNWVEDRAMIMDGKLTPAGPKVYTLAHKAALAIVRPMPIIRYGRLRRLSLTSVFQPAGCTLAGTTIMGRLAYLILWERKQDNESDFKGSGAPLSGF